MPCDCVQWLHLRREILQHERRRSAQQTAVDQGTGLAVHTAAEPDEFVDARPGSSFKALRVFGAQPHEDLAIGHVELVDEEHGYHADVSTSSAARMRP